MKMLFGQSHAVTTRDGIRFWIEGRRVFDGVRGYKFASVVIWQHPAKQNAPVQVNGGYWNIIRFNKPRPSAKEVQEVVDAARLAVIAVGGTFRHWNGPIFTVIEKVEGGVKATYTEEPINQIFNVPASCIVEVL